MISVSGYKQARGWSDYSCPKHPTNSPYPSDEALDTLAKSISTLKMEKARIGWDLEHFEALTQQDPQRETDSDDETGSEDEVERMLPASLQPSIPIGV